MHLSGNRSIKDAFEQGKVSLMLEGIPQEHIPVMTCKRGVSASKLFLLEDAESEDLKVAKRMITYLENRRILYGPLFKNCPGGIAQSVNKIRRRLQEELENLDRASFLYQRLDSVRFATLQFLNEVCKDCEPISLSCDNCVIHQSGCADILLTFRRKVGDELASIVSHYRIVIKGDLNTILPSNKTSLGDERGNKPSPEILKKLLMEVPQIKRLSYDNPDAQTWYRTIKAAFKILYGDGSVKVDEFNRIRWSKTEIGRKEITKQYKESCSKIENLLKNVITSLPIAN